MKALRALSIAAVAIWLAPGALADKYDDLVKQGYRWITVDGPYAATSREDLRQIVKDRTEAKELEFIEQLRAYYLLPGTVVRVEREDATSGTSQIQIDGVRRPLWTLSRFLSRHPIADVYGEIENPFEAGTTLNKPIEANEAGRQFGTIRLPNRTAFSAR